MNIAPRRVPCTGLLLLALVSMASLTACSDQPSSASAAPVLQVVTALYPLQQAAEQIGQSKAVVTDSVPAGANPVSYQLTPAQVTQVEDAGLVIEVGAGFQPAFEQASQRSHRALSLTASLGRSAPYAWLNPELMEKAVTAIAAAMEQANPAAASLYRDGAEAFNAEVSSTGIDYENTLSSCPRSTIFTADGAFTSMAAEYGLHDQVLSPGGGGDVGGLASQVKSSGVTTVFTEPWIPQNVVDAVAQRAHVKVRTLDTLTGPSPTTPWPRQATYINLMEMDLGTLSNALGCPNLESGS